MENLIVVWVDNRASYDESWFFKDTFWGLTNVRISVQNGHITQSTCFRNGCLSTLCGKDRVFEHLHTLIRHGYKVIVRLLSEWTLPATFYQSQELILSFLLERVEHSLLDIWLHIGDTHHGIHPLRQAVLYSSHIQPHIITCNQAQHLHHFSSPKTTAYLNLPRISISNLHHYSNPKLQAHRLGRSIFFPSRPNSIHLRRLHLSALVKQLNPDYTFNNSRYACYFDWLQALCNCSAFLYIPVGNSIGLNNLLPCLFTSTPVLMPPLSSCTGLYALVDYFQLKMNYTLGDIHISSKPNSILSDSPLIQRMRLLPTPKAFVSALTSRAYYPYILDPRHLDSRFSRLTSLRRSLAPAEYSLSLSIYESAQNLIELHQAIVPWSFHVHVRTNANLAEYLKSLLRDLQLELQYLPEPCPSIHAFVGLSSDYINHSNTTKSSYEYLLLLDDDHTICMPGYSFCSSPNSCKPLSSLVLVRQDIPGDPLL